MKFTYFKKIPATYLLISICLSAFMAEFIYGIIFGEGALIGLFNTFGFSIQGFFQGKIWTLITSIFLHANAMHLVLNMVALFFFGKVVETELGWKKLLLIFFAAGIIGDLATIFTGFLGLSSFTIATIGASAAIFGLMGAAMLVKPLEFVFFPYLIPIPLMLVAVLYTLYNVLAYLAVLLGGAVSNVAYMAHIGGLIAGMIFGFKEVGKKRGMLLLAVILLILILAPILWYYIGLLEIFNYVNIFTEAVG